MHCILCDKVSDEMVETTCCKALICEECLSYQKRDISTGHIRFSCPICQVTSIGKLFIVASGLYEYLIDIVKNDYDFTPTTSPLMLVSQISRVDGSTQVKFFTDKLQSDWYVINFDALEDLRWYILIPNDNLYSKYQGSLYKIPEKNFPVLSLIDNELLNRIREIQFNSVKKIILETCICEKKSAKLECSCGRKYCSKECQKDDWNKYHKSVHL